MKGYDMSIDNYLIRQATVADVPAIVAFGAQVSYETYVKTNFLPADYVTGPQRYYWSSDYLLNSVQAARTLLLLAFDDDVLIGMTEVEQLSETEAVMWKLYVHHNYHGQGLGSRLMQEIEARLPDNIEQLKTEYYDSNTPAAGFYKARGFEFLERKQEQFADHHFSYTYVSKMLKEKQ